MWPCVHNGIRISLCRNPVLAEANTFEQREQRVHQCARQILCNWVFARWPCRLWIFGLPRLPIILTAIDQTDSEFQLFVPSSMGGTDTSSGIGHFETQEPSFFRYVDPQDEACGDVNREVFGPLSAPIGTWICWIMFKPVKSCKDWWNYVKLKELVHFFVFSYWKLGPPSPPGALQKERDISGESATK